jgi:radical SAM superfamily enzyme YgiQ (UPF0313 family)
MNKNIIGMGTAYLTEPLALEVIAGSVPEHDARILDMRIDTDLDKILNNFNPEVVGSTAYTSEVYSAWKVLQKVKEYNKEIKTIVGGHHATILPEDFNKSYIDIVVIGEGEITFSELIRAFEMGRKPDDIEGLAIQENGKLFFTREREIITDMDKIPFPARKLTSKYRDRYFRADWRPVASLMTSKGCPYRCNFCSLWKIMKGRYLTRSAESVVEELKGIEEKYIDFADDNTLHDIKRAENIYELIKKEGINKTYKIYARSDTIVKHPEIIEKWKEIGTELVLVGIESFRDDELKKMNKHNTVRTNEEAINILHKNDVEVAAYFIINPDYEIDDFNALAEYVRKMNLKHPIFTVLTPFPGTEIFEERKKELLTYNYEYYDGIHSVLPTKLKKEEFFKCLIGLYKKCYGLIDMNGVKKVNMTSELMDRFYSNLIKANL